MQLLTAHPQLRMARLKAAAGANASMSIHCCFNCFLQMKSAPNFHCNVTFHDDDPFAYSEPAISSEPWQASKYSLCPLHRSLPGYFRTLLPHNPDGSRHNLPEHWSLDQTGSRQVSFTEHAPLPSSCIDIAATIARKKPVYAVQLEACRPSPKILILADYTLLVPLIRFRARSRQILRRCWCALQGPKPFRIFIPTNTAFSAIISNECLTLIEATTWDDLVKLLAVMVPLSRQELVPLMAAAKLAADLVLILDHSENVFDALHPLFFSPATDTAVTMSEVNLADLSDGRFVSDTVNVGAGHSVLADWCKRTPSIPCVIEANELSEYKHKTTFVVNTEMRSAPFDLQRFQGLCAEHLEIRSEDDEMILILAQDQMRISATSIVKTARLKPSTCSYLLEKLNFSRIESIFLLIDNHFDYNDPRALFEFAPLLRFVIGIALPSSCMQCPLLVDNCPRARHISITVGCDADLTHRSWINLPQVRSLEIKFCCTDCAGQELLVLPQIPLCLRNMGNVETLILSSNLPSVFEFPVDLEVMPIFAATASVFLNFPCTKSHSEQFFKVVFPNSERIRLLESIEPTCVQTPVEVTRGKVARVTIREASATDVSDYTRASLGQCATVEVHCINVSDSVEEFFIRKFSDFELCIVRNVIFIYDFDEPTQLNVVRRRMIRACVHTVPSSEFKKGRRNLQHTVGGGSSGGGAGGGAAAGAGGGSGGRRVVADERTGPSHHSLSARVFFEGHNPIVYRLQVYDTVAWEENLGFCQSERLFARSNLMIPCQLPSANLDNVIECKVPLNEDQKAVPQLWVGDHLSLPCRVDPSILRIQNNDICVYQLYPADAGAELQFTLTQRPFCDIVAPALPDDIQRALDAINVLDKLGIQSGDAPFVKVQKICDYCRNFSELSLPSEVFYEFEYSSQLAAIHPSRRSAFMLFHRMFLSQAGVCRHRSQVATVLCHYVGVPALYVTNDLHAFIEVVLDGRLQSFDLGGGEGLSISYASPDGTPLSRPRFMQDSSRFNWTSSTRNMQTGGNLDVVPSFVSAERVPAPEHHFPSHVEAILQIVRVDVKHDVKSVIETLELGRSLLVESGNCGRDSKLLLNGICSAVRFQGWAVLHVESLDAFHHAWEDIVYVEENGTFELKSRREPVCLLIDYAKIPHNHLVDLQASIVARLCEPSGTTCVIGLIDRLFAAARSEDFFSRWNKRVLFECHDSNDDTHSIQNCAAGTSSHCVSIDLHCSSMWESVLYGSVSYDGSKWMLQPGELQRIFKETESRHLHLTIQNPPVSDESFAFAWETLLRNRGFTRFGFEYRVPLEFSWSFQTTTAEFNLPEFELPLGMTWFVSSGTIAFLQPFTNISPSGNFERHGGYLQEVFDSGADVVLDSMLSRNELAHIIASDLKGHEKTNRLFVSGTFKDGCDLSKVLAKSVQGRAIRFSLNERVVEALKRQLDGLKFEETQWLHDLEEETNVFTIVMPVDHPDIPQVLNWIRYRQIWFPHRAVHIKAQLHIMHTERLEQQRRADLSATDHDALDQLEDILRHERLVQLSGPPGCGKTTLTSRFHRDERAKEEGGLIAQTPISDSVSSNQESSASAVKRQFLPSFLPGDHTPSAARLKRFSVTTQNNQLLMFLLADCDALLVVEEFNLQNDGWWDNLLHIKEMKAPEGRFFYKGTYYESRHCKCVLLIGNSATQGGRVSTAVETHCFLVECKAMNTQELVRKAMPRSMFNDNDRLELQTWANVFCRNSSFVQSNYALTLRDLEAVVFEALHVGISIGEAGQRVLGYYCGDMLPVQQGIIQRVCSLLKPAEGQAAAYLTCEPLAQRRKHGLFFVWESGVGKTTMCLKAIEMLKRPYFAMSQSDKELWDQVTGFLQQMQLSDPDALQQLEREMRHYGEHQLREKAVLVAAKCGLVLFIDELNTDRNLRLEEVLNQVSVCQPQTFKRLCDTESLQVLSSGSGSNVDANFFVIATGNPSRFHGRLELPMSLQTRFTTVLLQPIQPDELMLIIKVKAPDMPDDEARRWCSAFDVAKRSTPMLTTRALWEALKDTSGCPDGVPRSSAAKAFDQDRSLSPFKKSENAVGSPSKKSQLDSAYSGLQDKFWMLAFIASLVVFFALEATGVLTAAE
jgi:hypothetical protein